MIVQYKCPVCAGAMQTTDQSQLACAQRHSFDIAKQGYVNLQLVHERRSHQPGDSAEMLASRSRFLNAGYFDFLVDHLVATLAADLPVRGAFLDQGCGEGFYLDRIIRSLPEVGPEQWWGIDIAKIAIKRSAQRRCGAHLAVAASRALPFFAADFDRIISVFAPYDPIEMARVLKPGGQVIVVGPEATHLDGLRALVYDHDHPHQGNFKPMIGSKYFTRETSAQLQKSVLIKGSEIADLLAMTPYYWTAGAEAQALVHQLESLRTNLAFDVQVYRRLAIPVDSDDQKDASAL